MNNYIDTDSPKIIPSLDWVPIRLNSEFQVLGIRRSRAGCSWICNSLSRKKTEATCFLFLFTLSGPPPFFLSSFFSVFFFLFPRRTGRKIEQPRGREKKEQMNRSRMESRCSSSWFTAVEFNPCRQITIVISNYNSVTGRTVTGALAWTCTLKISNRVRRSFPSPPLCLLPAFLSLSRSSLVSRIRDSRCRSRKTTTNRHGSHRMAVRRIHSTTLHVWRACYELLELLELFHACCVRWNERVFNKNRYWSFNWTNIHRSSVRKESRETMFKKRKNYRSNLLPGRLILNHVRCDKYRPIDRREFNYGRLKPESSDQAAFRDDTVTGNIFTYSQNNTSHRTFDTIKGEEIIHFIHASRWKRKKEGMIISSTQKFAKRNQPSRVPLVRPSHSYRLHPLAF